jgi:hypothetical protein
VNRLFGILVGMLVISSAIADENDFRCFKSVGLKNPLRLQFVFHTEKDDVGYVRYESGSGPIRLKRLKEKELRRGPDGRPSEFETEWREIIPNGVGGTYLVVSQGAVINEFKYIRPDGKTFRFDEDPDASTDNGCKWSSN